MLHLASSTPPDWSARAVREIDEILVDHAHCEKRAASTAIGLLFRYPEHPSLAIPLSRLAREELAHFEEVVEVLERRGLAFRRVPPAAYAGRLVKVVRGAEPGRAIDTLICCALIEARSCERMRLLAERLEQDGGEEYLARLYRGLLAAEARHHDTYLDLVRGLGLVTEDELRTRLREIAAHEAHVVATADPEPRLHG